MGYFLFDISTRKLCYRKDDRAMRAIYSKLIEWAAAEIQPFEVLYRITGCGDMAIRVSLGHMEPHLGEGEVVGGSAMAPLERAMVISYRLSIVTVALSVTIRPQFAIERLWRPNQQGVGHLSQNFQVLP